VAAEVQRVDPAARRAALEAAVADVVARDHGGRVAFQGEATAVVVTGRPVNHLLHLILTLLTGGLWLVVWALVTATGGERSQTLTVDEDGSVRVSEPNRTRTTGTWRPVRLAQAALIGLGALFVLLGALADSDRVPALVVGLVSMVTGACLLASDVRRFGTGRVVPVSRVLHPR
jgi:hypothetical protein